MTKIIKKEDIEKVLSMKLVLDTVENAFKSHGLGKVQMPPKSYLQFEKGDLRSMPAYINDGNMNMAGIKSVNVHPGNKSKGLPTVMATIVLTDPETGYNIAILDGTLITQMRTGAAGGVAAKYLSRKDSRVAGFIGAGAQARTQLDALMQVRKIKEIRVYDISNDSSGKFCEWVENKYGIDALPVETIEQAAKNSDILTTVTPTSRPLVKKEFVSEGTHINAIGADAQGKQELYSDLTKSAKIVIDCWEQASHSGEINIPVSEGLIKKEDIHAELGEIVAGKKKGRENDSEITLFDSTGLAIQDVSTAYAAYKKIKEEKIKCLEVKFF